MNAATDPPDDPSFAENPPPASPHPFPPAFVDGLHDGLERVEAMADLLGATDVLEVRPGTVEVTCSIILKEAERMRELLRVHEQAVEPEIEEP